MLEALNGHLGEFVIVEHSELSTAILARLHPYIQLIGSVADPRLTLNSDVDKPQAFVALWGKVGGYLAS